DFIYKDFKQLTTDYSGKNLPSVPPTVIAMGMDAEHKTGLYININAYYADAIPLNDANTESAASYTLLGARAGWKKHLHPKVLMELFIAADNLLDEKYSLGNDINGFGGRYYNAAMPFNFAGGISLNFNFK